jgi:RNA polymerase sigma-54 factor
MAIKEKLKGILEGEDPQAPFSDLKLAEILEQQGIQIARRTVAKYREEIKVQPAHLRKKT